MFDQVKREEENSFTGFLGERIAFAADIGSWVWFHVVPQIFLVPLFTNTKCQITSNKQDRRNAKELDLSTNGKGVLHYI